jgi:hypothetical protein
MGRHQHHYHHQEGEGGGVGGGNALSSICGCSKGYYHQLIATTKNPNLGAALENFPPWYQKNSSKLHIRQQKKTEKEKEQPHLMPPPPNCWFPISAHWANINAQVNIMQCFHCTLLALAT